MNCQSSGNGRSSNASEPMSGGGGFAALKVFPREQVRGPRLASVRRPLCQESSAAPNTLAHPTMFENKSDIYSFLADSSLAPYAATLEEFCLPAVAFQAGAKPVAARFGGLPDLPPDLDWPVREAYEGGHVIAEKLKRGDELMQALTTPLPLEFVGEIDLAEIAEFEALEDFLPFEGRLLFFWDGICGPWIESAASCRVIWDRSSPARRAERDIPDALRTLMTRTGREGFKPSRQAGLVKIWTMPDRGQFKDLIDDDDILDALDSDDADTVFDAQMDLGMGRLETGLKVLPHRVGGWPYPEQWDPRFTAAASAKGVLRLFHRQPNAVERAICEAEMHDWTLLLQVGLADVTRDFAEGTVYFVMRKADLARRDFSRVHAIYQQT